MKITATKYEDVEVEINEGQVENLMCQLLKQDYKVWDSIPMENKDVSLLEAMAIVYEAYSGKHIAYEERFSH